MRHIIEAVISARAKLNLSLDIIGDDGLGYHLLDGVMLSIDLADRVSLKPYHDGEFLIKVTGPFKNKIPDGNENLAAKAARLFYSETNIKNPGLYIKIEKNIPAEAGLGGGSADAAAVLKGLNSRYDDILTRGELSRLGLALGADIPFCLTGGCARAGGRGEKLEPLKGFPSCFFVIAKPGAGISTKNAFCAYDRRETEPRRPDIPAMIRAIESGELKRIGGAMGNVFEETGAPKEVAAIKAAMLEQGAYGAAMTGTGTAVAALFAGEEAAARCREGLLKLTPAVFIARPTAGITTAYPPGQRGQ